jgi:DNA-binding MarR family transcriptional regulator
VQSSDDEPGLARLAGQPSWMLARVASLSHRIVSEEFATVGARGYHYRLLAAIDELGPASQADLGRRSGIYLSDVVAAINELVDQGFAERTADPTDRRRNVITLTDAGEGQLRRLDEQMVQIQKELMSPLSDRESRQLLELLEKMLKGHRLTQSEHRAPATAPRH